MNPLTLMPAKLTAGTTLVVRRSLADFPASDGWAITTTIAGPIKISTESAADGDTHVVTFDAADTAPLRAGTYRWQEFVKQESTGKVYKVSDGRIIIDPNLETATDGDWTEWAEATLAALEGAWKGEDTALRYQIGTRTLEHYSIDERIKLRNYLKAELARVRNGGGMRDVLVRFTGTGNEP